MWIFYLHNMVSFDIHMCSQLFCRSSSSTLYDLFNPFFRTRMRCYLHRNYKLTSFSHWERSPKRSGSMTSVAMLSDLQYQCSVVEESVGPRPAYSKFVTVTRQTVCKGWRLFMFCILSTSHVNKWLQFENVSHKASFLLHLSNDISDLLFKEILFFSY